MRHCTHLLRMAVLILGAVCPALAQPSLSPPLAKLIASHPVAQGGWLYTQNCYRCHLTYGQTRQGRGMSGDNLRKIVANGKTSTQMTGFAVVAGGKLVDSEIEAIVAYVVAWENFGGPPAIARQLLVPPAGNPGDLRPIGLPRFPEVEGDEERGRLLYRSQCSRCHNPDRSGFIGPSLLGPWESFRPDLFLKATVKSGVPGTLMPAFGTMTKAKLSPREIDDVVAFLRGASSG